MPRKRYDTPHRSRVVKTRMTEEEYAEFAARLAPYGISQSEFIRRAIQGASMGECHPYYQAKSTSNFDGLDRSCSYLWNGISAVEIFPKRLVYGELACLCNYSIAAFNNGGVGGQKRSALISRIIERYLFIAKRCKVMIQKWILCPVCGSKTRVRIREDTVLENFPLYCPKCKHETLISARQLNISVIKEPDAQTQSQ